MKTFRQFPGMVSSPAELWAPLETRVHFSQHGGEGRFGTLQCMQHLCNVHYSKEYNIIWLYKILIHDSCTYNCRWIALYSWVTYIITSICKNNILFLIALPCVTWFYQTLKFGVGFYPGSENATKPHSLLKCLTAFFRKSSNLGMDQYCELPKLDDLPFWVWQVVCILATCFVIFVLIHIWETGIRVTLTAVISALRKASFLRRIRSEQNFPSQEFDAWDEMVEIWFGGCFS